MTIRLTAESSTTELRKSDTDGNRTRVHEIESFVFLPTETTVPKELDTGIEPVATDLQNQLPAIRNHPAIAGEFHPRIRDRQSYAVASADFSAFAASFSAFATMASSA
jgi:hypothetical protein